MGLLLLFGWLVWFGRGGCLFFVFVALDKKESINTQSDGGGEGRIGGVIAFLLYSGFGWFCFLFLCGLLGDLIVFQP